MAMGHALNDYLQEERGREGVLEKGHLRSCCDAPKGRRTRRGIVAFIANVRLFSFFTEVQHRNLFEQLNNFSLNYFVTYPQNRIILLTLRISIKYLKTS